MKHTNNIYNQARIISLHKLLLQQPNQEFTLDFETQARKDIRIYSHAEDAQDYKKMCKSLRLYLALNQQKYRSVISSFFSHSFEELEKMDDYMRFLSSNIKLKSQTDISYLILDRYYQVYIDIVNCWHRTLAISEIFYPEDSFLYTIPENIVYITKESSIFKGRIFSSEDLHILNSDSKKLLQYVLNNKSPNIDKENESFKKYYAQIHKHTGNKQSYLLSSDPESVKALEGTQDFLLPELQQRYPFGLPDEKLIRLFKLEPKQIVQWTKLGFDPKSYKESPKESMFNILQRAIFGATIEQVTSWTQHAREKQTELLNFMVGKEPKEDKEDVNDLFSLKTLTNYTNISMAKLMITSFCNTTKFRAVIAICKEMSAKGVIMEYLSDLVIYFKDELDFTLFSLQEHKNQFLLQASAKAHKLTEEQINQRYIDTFGFDRRNTVTCLPSNKYINKAVIDTMDRIYDLDEGYRTSIFSSETRIISQDIIDFFQDQLVQGEETKQLFTLHGLSLILTTLDKIFDKKPTDVDKHLRKVSSELKDSYVLNRPLI